MLKKACGLHKATLVLLLIGGINWGLIGAFDYNLINELVGQWAVVEQIVYIAVGVGALLMLLGPLCKSCNK